MVNSHIVLCISSILKLHKRLLVVHVTKILLTLVKLYKENNELFHTNYKISISEEEWLRQDL